MSPLSLELEVDLGSEDLVDEVLAAIAPDNEGYVTARREGSVLRLSASAETPLSMLHTVEDLLPCMAVAVDVGSIGPCRP